MFISRVTNLFSTVLTSASASIFLINRNGIKFEYGRIEQKTIDWSYLNGEINGKCECKNNSNLWNQQEQLPKETISIFLNVKNKQETND